MEGKFLGRFFCLYLIGILHATTDHGELVPEEGRLVFLLPNGIRIVNTFLPFSVKIISLSRDDSGVYVCTASNGVRSPAVVLIEVVVHHAPVVEVNCEQNVLL